MRKLWAKQNGAAIECENSYWCEKFALVRKFHKQVRKFRTLLQTCEVQLFLLFYPTSSPSKI